MNARTGSRNFEFSSSMTVVVGAQDDDWLLIAVLSFSADSCSPHTPQSGLFLNGDVAAVILAQILLLFSFQRQ